MYLKEDIHKIEAIMIFVFQKKEGIHIYKKTYHLLIVVLAILLFMPVRPPLG